MRMPRRKHPPHRALQRTKPYPRHRSQSLGQRLRRNPRPAALPSGGQGAQASATASLFRCRKTTYRPDSTIHTLELQTVINNKYVRYFWRERIRNTYCTSTYGNQLTTPGWVPVAHLPQHRQVCSRENDKKHPEKRGGSEVGTALPKWCWNQANLLLRLRRPKLPPVPPLLSQGVPDSGNRHPH